MICILALVVFSILAIFSASHRPLAAEAFDCVFRKVTFRKCRTNLDQRLKSQITGKLMRKNAFLAKIVYKNFEIISWLFVILFIASLAYSAYGGYNYYLYGNCYGPEDTGGFCIYNALEGDQFSKIHTKLDGEIILPDTDDDPALGPADAKVEMIEFGCYMCPFSRQAQDVVKQVLDKYGDKIRFVYRDFPIEQSGDADLHIAANCALEQDKFWDVHDLLFTEQDVCVESTGEEREKQIESIAEKAGLDLDKFNECMKSGRYVEEIAKDFEDGAKAGVYGTPTFFINGRTIIGPKPLRAFEKIIDEELAKAENES
ncbi:DsbA family protein [Candidatus Woesearchaeota archaeon]|nr:DsbA family protein [Candidatus Woesearchaeota archaeon]MBW2993821.1 DsbA family protein [Candidatus Woesearchaeota archaeon]